jgi:nicotinate-nucleotide pyrophosphorylase (carboxylating)
MSSTVALCVSQPIDIRSTPLAATAGAVGVDAVLLDNMTPTQLTDAVRMVDGRAITEASGRITPGTAPAVAASGVDLISIGWLTHSATVLDIGLDHQGHAKAWAL